MHQAQPERPNAPALDALRGAPNLPNRIIRDGINSSSRINKLSFGAEILYRRLMSVADDYGRYYGTPAAVRGACWPTCPEKVSEKDVGKWISECAQGDRPLLRIYSVDGCKFLEILDFNQQTRSKSKFPQYDINLLSDCNQSDNNCLQNDVTSRSRISETKSKTKAESLVAAATVSDDWIQEPWPSVKAFIALYNQEGPENWPAVQKITQDRESKIKEYLAKFPERSFWDQAFGNAKASKFLSGYQNGTMDWFIQRGKNDGIENCLKCYEGKYNA